MKSLSANIVNKAVRDFTMSERFFTAYPADKVEVMLRYYHLIGPNDLYQGFTPEDELVYFVNQEEELQKKLNEINVKLIEE